MQTRSQDLAAEGRRSRGLLLWPALGLAFLPVLIDLVAHVGAQPWSRYALVFPALLAWGALRDPRPAAPARDGYLLLAVGVLVDLAALVGGPLRLGRLGLPLAIVGMCRAFGFARLPVALLALWIVPVPHALLKLGSPWLERAMAQWGGFVAGLLTAPVVVERSRISLSGGGIELDRPDGGLPLVVLLAGIGWYAAARAGRTLLRCALTAPVWGAAGLLAQALLVALVAALLAVAGPEPAIALLLHGWIGVALVAVAVAERRGGTASGDPA